MTKKSLTHKNKTEKQTQIQTIHAYIDAMDTTKKTNKETMNQKKHSYQYFFIQQHKVYQCPYCKNIFTFEKSKPITEKITCPQCGYHYLHPHNTKKDKDLASTQKKKTKKSKIAITIKPFWRKNKKQKQFFQKRKPKKFFQTIKKPMPTKKKIKTTTKTFIKTNPIELILLITGLLFLIQPTPENTKISLTFLIIGAILLLPTQKNKKTQNTPQQHKKTKTNQIKQIINQLNLQEKISITLITWILFLFIITTAQQLEIYFILIFIGILLTKELTTDLLPKKTQKRINLYIFIFLIIYIYLIYQKIMATLSTIS